MKAEELLMLKIVGHKPPEHEDTVAAIKRRCQDDDEEHVKFLINAYRLCWLKPDGEILIVCTDDDNPYFDWRGCRECLTDCPTCEDRLPTFDTLDDIALVEQAIEKVSEYEWWGIDKESATEYVSSFQSANPKLNMVIGISETELLARTAAALKMIDKLRGE